MDNSETKASDQSVNQVNQVRAVQAPKSEDGGDITGGIPWLLGFPLYI